MCAHYLTNLGCRVRIIDLNVDRLGDPLVQHALTTAQIVGVSVIGSPYIPETIDFAHYLHSLVPNTRLLVGGQVVEHLSSEHFSQMFAGTNAVQIADTVDFAMAIGVSSPAIPSAYEVSSVPVWDAMGDARLRQYLSTEFTLVVGQGCKYNCDFCAARKGQREQRVDVDVFSRNIYYLVAKARQFELHDLHCYASSLDFFQNPQAIAEHVRILAEAQEQSGVRFHMRCLSCTSSFMQASREIDELGELCKAAGLYIVGFGIDGTKEIWDTQNKWQNDPEEVVAAFRLCNELGIQSEALLVMGFPKDNPRTLIKLFRNSLVYAFKFGADIRPYVDKNEVPGNEGYSNEVFLSQLLPSWSKVPVLIRNPRQFQNLDYAACASELTDFRWQHRWMTNIAYVSLIAFYKLFGKSTNNPIFPQGGSGVGARLARVANRLMPYDR